MDSQGNLKITGFYRNQSKAKPFDKNYYNEDFFMKLSLQCRSRSPKYITT